MRIRDVLDKRSIKLDAVPMSKKEAINTLVDLMAQSGCLNDVEQYRNAVFEREEQSSTGLGEGIALPHAKSAGVSHPALASMIVPKGVEFESFDDEPAFLFFMIAAPQNASNAHLDVLARLSTLLMDLQFRDELLAAKSVDEYLEIIDRAEDRADARDAERAAENASDDESTTEHDNEASSSSSSSSSSGSLSATSEASTSTTGNSATNDLDQGSTDTTDIAPEATSSAQEHVKKDEPKLGRKKKVYDLVAVTACPAGLSHTFMAAEALEQKAKELGVSIKVEADGAAGNRNSLLPEDIAAAKAVIVAADRAIDIDRFMGKRMVRTGVVDGVHKPEILIKKALDPNCPVFKGGSITESSNLPMRLYRHLMSGLTYILPLAATAGILSAVARSNLLNSYYSDLALFLDTIGYSIGILIFPVLSAFIAFSLAGRTGLVAGFTGGVMADIASASVFAAVLNGFVGGGVALLLSRCAQRFLKGHDAMFALLVYPLAGAVLTTVIAQFITNLPAGLLGNFINTFISDANALTLALIGAALGGMMAADMGGPFNKLAYATGVLMLADCLPENGPGSIVMGSVMLGGMIPPLAAGVAAKFVAPKRFSEKEKSLAVGAMIKGCLFITEGVIPFLKAAPRLRIACVIGSAVAGGLSMFFSSGVVAPHGGVFIFLLAINPLHYLLSFFAGILMGAILFALLHPNNQDKKVAPKVKENNGAQPSRETSAQSGKSDVSQSVLDNAVADKSVTALAQDSTVANNLQADTTSEQSALLQEELNSDLSSKDETNLQGKNATVDAV